MNLEIALAATLQKTQETELNNKKSHLFEIEELQKKIRSLEFTYKNELKELKNELCLQKALSEDQKNKKSDKDLIEIAKELEQKLLLKENEVLKMKEYELELKKQLYQMKKTKNSIDNKNRFTSSFTPSQSKFSRLCSISISAVHPQKLDSKLEIISETSQDKKTGINRAVSMFDPKEKSHFKKKAIQEIKEFNPRIYDEYINKIKNENKTLQETMVSIRDAAIEAIIDKEKELYETKFQMEEMEMFYKEQIDISSNTIQLLEAKLSSVDSNKSDHSSLFMDKIKQLENEIEKNNQIYYDSQINFDKMKESFFEQIDEMNSRLEQQKNYYENLLKDKENEMTMALHEKISEYTLYTKISETKLYEELQLEDDTLKSTEKALKELQQESNSKEKKFYQEKKELLREIESLSRKLKELTPFKEKVVELEEKIKNISEENHEEMKKKIEKISIMEQNKVNLNKRLMTIVTEIRVAELKYDNIKKDNEDLILKLECCEREYEEHLKIMNLEFNTQKTNYEAIIDNLEMELDTIRKELEFSKESPENNFTLAESQTRKITFFSKSKAKEQEENEMKSELIPLNGEEINQKTEGKRMFSSIFSKEVVENDVMKAINEETLMDIDKDYDSLKNKYKKLEEECELYKKQLEDITKENDDLTNKILELKEMEETNKDLEILKEDYEKILDKYKKDLEVSNAQIHVLRAQLLDNKTYEIKLNELKEKIEMIEKEKSFMIENMIFFKEEMAKNYNFYNEELEKTKKEYIQSKIDYSQILMEKEYISLRCKKLENSLKQCVHG